MREVRYVGPYPAAEIHEIGLHVPNGKTAEVDDETAELLVAQVGNWEPVGWEPELPLEERDLVAGTRDEVLALVGDDRELAAAAIEAEQAKGDKARTSLLDRLSAIANKEG